MDDYMTLAAVMCGMSYQDDLDYFEIVERLYSEYDIDMDTFERIARRLIRFTIPAEGPLTGVPMHVFAVAEGQTYVAIVKEEVGLNPVS